MSTICELSFWIFLVITFIIVKTFVQKEEVSGSILIAWILTLILAAFHVPKVFGYGNTQIGSFYEKEEYTAYYEVILSKKPESASSRTEYRLKAKISRGYYDFYTVTSTDRFSGDSTEYDVDSLCYVLDRVYWNNGGYLRFDETEENALLLNQEVEICDAYDDTYYITLTDKKRK